MTSRNRPGQNALLANCMRQREMGAGKTEIVEERMIEGEAAGDTKES